MKTASFALLPLIIAFFNFTPAHGQWIQWGVNEGGNGHWYSPVRTPSLISWTEANDAARNATGHLATITSAAENNFVFNLINSPQYWTGELGPLLGGYQPPGSQEPTGGWTWVTGEPWGYSNWAGGQPDNGGEQEDGIHFWGGSQWNDKGTNRQQFISYVIERDTQPLSDSHDLSRDFAIVGNPNGVWSYGWKSNLSGPFTVFTHARTSTYDNGVPLQLWGLANGQVPEVYYNPSSNTGITDGGLGNYPPGSVWFLAGADGSPQNFCVIRFTVPTNGSGNYTLESAVRSRLDGVASTDADYHVVVNGVEVFGEFLPPNSTTGYTETLSLVAGSTIDLMVGRGADGSILGSGLKIQATLRHTEFCSPRKAKAAAQLINGFVVGATITDGGCGYTNPPIVLVQGGGGTGATATAVITDGRVTAITITDAGFGYENPPRIVIASPPFVPTLSISVSKVKVVQNVVLGRNYVLEASHDATSWSQAVPPFSATSESITNEFDADLTGRFFRVRETP